MDTYHFRPIGSMYTRPAEECVGYLDLIGNLPDQVKKLLTSPEISSYVIGLGKTYNIEESLLPHISFSILEIAIGKKTFRELATTLAKDLGLPSSMAQNMAIEIETDLFGPVKKELLGAITHKAAPQPQNIIPRKSMQNILNLKEIAARPQQTQLPANPARPSLQSHFANKPAPRIPLPPSPATPPKPPVSPITPLHFT